MITRVRDWPSYRASRTPTLHQRASRSDPQWAASPQCTSTGDKSEHQNMLTHAMEHSRVAAAARGRLLGLRRQDRPTLRTCSTLAFRRCWPTATSCISSRRNILTERVGWNQENLCRRTFLTRTATTRCFIQASYSSGLSTEISHVLGLTPVPRWLDKKHAVVVAEVSG